MRKLLDNIIELTTEYPNDMELGRGVRKLIQEYRKDIETQWESLKDAGLDTPWTSFDDVDDDITG